MELNYQIFIDIFTQIMAISFPLALIIGIFEKLSCMFFDMVFGRNLKL